MFGFIMPRGADKLSLSKMNMLGMGSLMMRQVMKNKNVTPLTSLIQSAKESGIHLLACAMSMDVMGLKKEELVDGIELGGVASFLGDADKSNVTLFI